MDTHTALRHAAKLEYALLRVPLNVVDERVVRRYLDAGSPVRQSFERALGALDDAVEKILREPDTSAPRRDEPRPAASTPTESRDAADDDEAEQIEHLTEELLDEEETETFVGELAEDDELRKVQAELQAKRLIEEQQEGR